MPREEPLTPDFRKLAVEIIGDVARIDGPAAYQPEVVVEQRLRQLWQAENVACESLATVTGDEQERHGRAEKAESAWAVAGRIRIRREKIERALQAAGLIPAEPF